MNHLANFTYNLRIWELHPPPPHHHHHHHHPPKSCNDGHAVTSNPSCFLPKELQVNVGQERVTNP